MSELQRLQLAFAAAVRDPAAAPPAGVEERRLAVYRELFYRNVESVLAKAFPVLRSIGSDDTWHARVRAFFARHRSHDPQFFRLAQEFLAFLEAGGSSGDDPPFLLELAHYEWAELELSISDAQPPAPLPADVLGSVPRLSPLAWALSYEWPVHRIGPDFLPDRPPPDATHVVVYRDRDDEVRFLEIDLLSARLLQLVQEAADETGAALLRRIAAELQHPQPQIVIEAGEQLLRQLSERGVIGVV